MKYILSIFLLIVGITSSQAQGFAFGIKGGPIIGLQNWSGFERDPLISYHGIAFIESLTEDNAFAIFAQAGYHVRGSAFRTRNFFSQVQGQVVSLPATRFEFNNLALTVGGKQKKDWRNDIKWYYAFGFRGEYTVSTNLGDFDEAFRLNAIYPLEGFVKRVNYGVYAAGGLEFPFSDLVGGVLEFSLNPDFSFQYEQPSIPNVIDLYTGQNRTLPERTIRNITFEVTLGIRLLRIVEYID